MTRRDLFGTVRLVLNLGRNGQETVEIYDDEGLEAVAQAKRRRAIGSCD
jgi:hypothetical protein